MSNKYNLGEVGGITKTELYNGNISSVGTYDLSDSVDNYKLIVIEHYLVNSGSVPYYRSETIAVSHKNINEQHIVCHGNDTVSSYVNFYFSSDGKQIIATTTGGNYHISKIYGIN